MNGREDSNEVLRSGRTGAVVDPMRGQSDHSRTPVLLTFLVRLPSVEGEGGGGSGGGSVSAEGSSATPPRNHASTSAHVEARTAGNSKHCGVDHY